MKRELKFRAWNEKWEQMVYSDHFPVYDKRAFFFFGFDVGYSNYPHNPDNTIIEQFTGLKDKNGKEIYEGDILKKRNQIYKVGSLSVFGCVIKGRSGLGNHLSLSNLRQVLKCEIIGNIHENPELLTLKQ